MTLLATSRGFPGTFGIVRVREVSHRQEVADEGVLLEWINDSQIVDLVTSSQHLYESQTLCSSVGDDWYPWFYR
jgi:hypothetical protein